MLHVVFGEGSRRDAREGERKERIIMKETRRVYKVVDVFMLSGYDKMVDGLCVAFNIGYCIFIYCFVVLN
jgi:hypothetical protein